METIIRTFWKASVIGLAEVNKDGKFIRANPAFCNLLGYSEAELQEKTWREITHPEDMDGGQPMFEKSIAGIINSYTMEKRYITKRGNIIWVSLFACAITDEAGQFKLLLKQVVSAPIVIETNKEPEAVPKALLKDNGKLVATAAIGAAMTIVGAILGHSELYHLGSALVVGLVGGVITKK